MQNENLEVVQNFLSSYSYLVGKACVQLKGKPLPKIKILSLSNLLHADGSEKKNIFGAFVLKLEKETNQK